MYDASKNELITCLLLNKDEQSLKNIIKAGMKSAIVWKKIWLQNE